MHIVCFFDWKVESVLKGWPSNQFGEIRALGMVVLNMEDEFILKGLKSLWAKIVSPLKSLIHMTVWVW